MFCSVPGEADSELTKLTQASSQQAQVLSQLSASTAGRFIQAVQQANLFVLPDVKLALKEQEPTLSTSLLDMMEGSLAELKTQGEDMLQQHTELQSHMQGLLVGSQRCMLARGCALAKVEKQLDSPRSVQTASTEYESSEDGDQSSDDGYRPCNCKAGGILNTRPAVVTTPGDGQASVSQALEVLKQVDELVEIDVCFWRDMNETVQKLVQMKHHTSCLLQCASSSDRLRARVAQRLDEFSNMWASLESPCNQYIAEHQKSEVPMYELPVPSEIQYPVEFGGAHGATPRAIPQAIPSMLLLRAQ